QDGYHGVKEMPVAGSISFTARDAGSSTVYDFNRMRNATVVSQLANGKTVVGRSMACVDAQEVDTTEATFDVKFEGPLKEIPDESTIASRKPVTSGQGGDAETFTELVLREPIVEEVSSFNKDSSKDAGDASRKLIGKVSGVPI
ncbi:hypothetical protein OY671_012061, partial [Metschnikowia pulcherrima]